jgi:pimeloyl-ACP methyl ester carboxylesterase
MAPSTLAGNSTNVRRFDIPARPAPLASWLSIAGVRAKLAVASVLAPAKAADMAASLFSTPPRHPHTARERELLATGVRFDVSAGFRRIAAWRFGRADRPAVVASHGWGGRGAQWRAFVPALLEEGYQVVVFDHAGHGHSDGHESTLVHFIDGLDAVIRHLEASGAQVAALLGHSLGAAAVGAWLNRNGRGIPAVLVAPPASVLRHSHHFARRLGIPERVRRAMQEKLEHRLGRPWTDFELPGSVAHVASRVLVIHDAGDSEVSFAAGLAVARSIPGAVMSATHGLGHRLILRDPQVVTDALDFLGARVVFAPPPASGARTFDAPAPIA